MIKFPKIKQFRDVKYNAERSKFLRLDDEDNPVFDTPPALAFRGTVKLDGTNAGVRFDDGKITAQSRNRDLTADNDNAGFCEFVENNVVELEKIKAEYDDGSGRPIVLFGEWVGCGIQKKTAISHLSKRFVVFCAQIGEDDDKKRVHESLPVFDSIKANIFHIDRFKKFEIQIDFSDDDDVKCKLDCMGELTDEVDSECPVAKEFNKAGIGEGIVWHCVTDGYESSDYWFKTKGESHRKTKSKISKLTQSEKNPLVIKFVEEMVNRERYDQALEHLKDTGMPISVRSTGNFIKFVVSDIIEEGTVLMDEMGLSAKEVSPVLSSITKTEWFRILNNRLAELTDLIDDLAKIVDT